MAFPKKESQYLRSTVLRSSSPPPPGIRLHTQKQQKGAGAAPALHLHGRAHLLVAVLLRGEGRGGDAVHEHPGANCIKIGLPGKSILSKRNGLWEVIFSWMGWETGYMSMPMWTNAPLNATRSWVDYFFLVFYTFLVIGGFSNQLGIF